jgi:hypothetical protein
MTSLDQDSVESSLKPLSREPILGDWKLVNNEYFIYFGNGYWHNATKNPNPILNVEYPCQSL